ncbi:glycosyltransferase family 39 protein [Phaeacidiphilus oryzae]|uniref:glycosyltransferase family 39 protein n=1 Tax=Phaeacidiphilus oryzae TaxID=348818 RepID=UPI000A00FEE5|nr:glycosyltransferase family 39 protein [Phaeacidiphilus oryzae]
MPATDADGAPAERAKAVVSTGPVRVAWGSEGKSGRSAGSGGGSDPTGAAGGSGRTDEEDPAERTARLTAPRRFDETTVLRVLKDLPKPVTGGRAAARRARTQRAGAASGGYQHPWQRWESGALAGVLALAALLYGWGMDHAQLHPYYTAAVRSMAASWHAFVYGGVDVSGSVSVDKLPGGLWPQALSVRIFGPHSWAAALPQVVEGVLTVYLTHRYVRAWAGPVAAAIAALVLTLTPVAVVLDRHNIPDTLLTLLLVLAAGACQKALHNGRFGPLLWCGVWVGLAFQAKMLQAWLVLPAFAAVYLFAGPGGLGRRALRLLPAGLLSLLVSCFWIILVQLTPAGSRPYLDGTSNNNPFTLVFGYNGLSRFGSDPTALGAVAGTSASRTTGNTGLGMLVNHVVGPQISWFLPLALMALVLAVVWGRGEERTEPFRAGFLMWGGWLLVQALIFSASNGNHGYYMVVLAPAIAALAGGGLKLCWNEYHWGEGRARRWALPAGLGFTLVWALWLQSPHHGFTDWMPPLAVMLGFCGVLGLAARGPRTRPRTLRWAFAAGVAATLVAPAVWGFSALNPVYAGADVSPLAGPVGSEFTDLKHHEASVSTVSMNNPTTRDRALLGYLTAHRGGAKYLLAAQAAYSAEPLLRDTPEPILVLGGFTGLTPFPSQTEFASYVTSKQVRYALLTTRRPDTPATRWVKQNCAIVPSEAYGRQNPGSFTLHDCATKPAKPAKPAKRTGKK